MHPRISTPRRGLPPRSTFATLLVLFFAVLLSAGAAGARTEVCAEQQGAAFGLCNAYCEAMDCDGDSPFASEQACGQVRGQFESLTGGPLPCERSACPCNQPGSYWESFVAVDPALGNFQCWNNFARLRDVAVLTPGGAPLLYAGANPTVGFCNDIVTGFAQGLDGETAAACYEELQGAVDTYGVVCLQF